MLSRLRYRQRKATQMTSFKLGNTISADLASALHRMATRTVITRYQAEADVNKAHAEALAYSPTIGKTIRPIPAKDSLYYVQSDRNPCQVERRTKDGVRAVTSGGPSDRSAHLAYQVAYQAGRSTKGYGVTFPSGRVVRYATRGQADKARRVLRTIGTRTAAVLGEVK